MSVFRATALLVAGRAVGFVAAFGIPVVLARVFSQEEFGTYKLLFIIFSTMYGVAQLGMAESLYYFVPGRTREAGRHVANAVVALTVTGLLCVAVLTGLRTQIAAWLTNPTLAEYLPLLGMLLALMLIATVLEIVMITRNEHKEAAFTYAGSDLMRALLFIVPAVGFRSIRGVLIGAVAFSALRVGAMFVYLWREFGRDLRVDRALLRTQLAYALPFALAVGIEVVQLNLHQYIVAARYDARTFAIYTVGCLQIPLVDLVMTSTVNVMMVKMGEEASAGRTERALALFHATVRKLCLLFFPLTALMVVAARQVILTLFTARYEASVPIFIAFTLTVLPAAFAVDGVLRTFAQTRFLLIMNVVRLAVVVGLVGWFLSAFGMMGAVLVTLLAAVVVKSMGVVRIAHVLGVPMREVLPWSSIGAQALRALIAAVPAFWITRSLSLPPLAVAICAGLAYSLTYAALVYNSEDGRELVAMLPWSRRFKPAAYEPTPTTV